MGVRALRFAARCSLGPLGCGNNATLLHIADAKIIGFFDGWILMDGMHALIENLLIGIDVAIQFYD